MYNHTSSFGWYDGEALQCAEMKSRIVTERKYHCQTLWLINDMEIPGKYSPNLWYLLKPYLQ